MRKTKTVKTKIGRWLYEKLGYNCLYSIITLKDLNNGKIKNKRYFMVSE